MKKWTFCAISAAAIVVLPHVSHASTIHSVLPGDTLSKIASQYNVTIQQLFEWNHLQSDRIFVGQQLKISSINKEKGKLIASNKKHTNVVPSVKNPSVPNDSVGDSFDYTIAAGDTLSKIASKFNTTVALLKQWNSLKNDLIYVGQSLKISTIKPEDVEAVIEYDKVELSKTDLQIVNQLNREIAIINSPLQEGLAFYEKVLSLANSLKGVPYVFGGNTVAGFDCSGYINYVFSHSGMTISRKSSLDYFLYDTIKVTNPIPGDVVFFKNTYMSGISHMGIYLGNDQFIHAGSNGIELSKLSYDYWQARFVVFKRFKEVAGAGK